MNIHTCWYLTELKKKNMTLTKKRIEQIKARRTQPKKYTDSNRFQLTEEYKIWADARPWLKDSALHEKLLCQVTPKLLKTLNEEANVDAIDQYMFPKKHGKHIDEGRWIIVTNPPTSVNFPFEIPVYSAWFATSAPTENNAYRVHIATPKGSMYLWPHEYVVPQTISSIIDKPGVKISRLNGEPAAPEDELFYLMSRGIDKHQALLMLIDSLTKADTFIYITISPKAFQTYVDSLKKQSHLRTMIEEIEKNF